MEQYEERLIVRAKGVGENRDVGEGGRCTGGEWGREERGGKMMGDGG